MTPLHYRITRTALHAALCAAALVGASGAAAQAGHQHHAAPPSDTSRFTAADVHFMSGMIGHHAQAIDMARLAPTHDASPALLRLTERIINAQQDEIAAMQRWLRDRNQPVPEARAVPMMHDGHLMLMPGMLTEAQMRQLDAARGPEFDRLFLTLMIQHHSGAVSMVSELFGSYGAGQDDAVFKIASDINVDQTTEIARMQRMLADLIFGSSSQ
jgi:uncharacterized protein (DUF305 family)